MTTLVQRFQGEVLGHEPTDMADGPRTWLMRIPNDAWVPRVLVADSTDVGGVRCECGLQGSALRDSGGATAEACAPARSLRCPLKP